MTDAGKSKKQLIEELEQLRMKVAKLEEKHDSNSSLGILLQNLQQKIFLKDSQSAYIFCNDKYALDLGIEPHKIKGMNDHDFFPKELAEKYRRDDKNLMQQGECQDVVEKYQQGGEDFWIHTFKTPIFDEAGNAAGILGIFWDITAYKQAEDHRSFKENKCRELIEKLLEGVWEIDLNLNTTFVNSTMARILGYTVEEMMGKHFFSFLGEDGKAIAAQNLEKIASGTDDTVDFVFLNRAGNQVYAALEARTTLDMDGNRLGYIACVNDVTELKGFLDRLFESEERLRFALDATQEVVWDCDLVTGVIKLSHRLCELLGVTEDTLEQPVAVYFDLVHPDDMELVQACLRAAYEKEAHYTTEYRLRHVDGHYILVSDYGRVVTRNVKGEPQRAVGAFSDVTFRKQLEAERDQSFLELNEYRDHLENMIEERTVELFQAKEIAEAANGAKGRFLANMSHEIRSPMNSLLGLTEVVLKSELNRQQRDMLTIVHKSGTILLSLLNEILDYSKIESGLMTIEQTPINIDAQIATTRDMFCDQAKTKGLYLQVELDPDVPRYLVGDSLRLVQVLGNLVGNAIKFTAHGGVVLSVMLDADAAPSENSATIRFVVRDSGIGITTEQRENIFLPFVQADNSTTRKFGGTGLGLAICRNLIRLMGGELEVESVPGQGSCFSFSLQMPIMNGEGVFSAATLVKEVPDQPDSDGAEYTASILVTQEQRNDLLAALTELKPILREHELLPRELLQTLQRLETAGLPYRPVMRLLSQINSFDNEEAFHTLIKIETMLSESFCLLESSG